MTLIERAQDIVRRGTPQDLQQLLRDCVNAGTIEALSAVQLLAEDMYDGITFNFELKPPAAWCLMAWQTPGLQVLVEIPRRTSTTKNYSLAFQILSTLAANERLPNQWL